MNIVHFVNYSLLPQQYEAACLILVISNFSDRLLHKCVPLLIHQVDRTCYLGVIENQLLQKLFL